MIKGANSIRAQGYNHHSKMSSKPKGIRASIKRLGNQVKHTLRTPSPHPPDQRVASVPSSSTSPLTFDVFAASPAPTSLPSSTRDLSSPLPLNVPRAAT
jgi:hypothetical protein